MTPSTVRNPAALPPGDPARPLLRGGLAVAPRGLVVRAAFWRLLLEHALVRYALALAPFPLAMLVWPELALPISQAPLLMIGIVLFIETNVLAIPSRERRDRLVAPEVAERGLDLLRARAQAFLTRAAAERDLAKGSLFLVIEQSAMARVAPLTLVSLQSREAAPPVLELQPAEAQWLGSELFDAALSERDLHRINLAADRFVRVFEIEACSVSAHARLAAMARRAWR